MFTPSANATATPVCDLLKCLLEEYADKKASILAHVLGVVNKLIEKKVSEVLTTTNEASRCHIVALVSLRRFALPLSHTHTHTLSLTLSLLS